MGRVFFTTDFDMFPNTDEDISQKLQKAFDSLPDGAVFQFKKGRYNIFKKVFICGKRNLTVLGNKSTVVAHFTSIGPISENNNVFECWGSDDLEISDFFFETDNPINATGRVAGIDRESGTVDIRLYDDFPVTGFEHILETNSFDDKGSPDYALSFGQREPYEQEFTAPDGKRAKRLVGIDYSIVEEQTLRLKLNNNFSDKLKIGHEVNVRYEIYGNEVFSFHSCNRVLLKDIIIHAAASFGACIYPRSSDFTFDNFCICPKEGSKMLMASNADGIHILGLFGSLTLRNCNMEHMGDDTLNIHGLAGGIMKMDKDKGEMSLYRPFRGEVLELPEFWAVEGDRINVYDSETFLYKGAFTVDSVDADYNITFKDMQGDVQIGDTLANATYFASLHIDGCVVRNTRARGFLVQTHNVLIENSYIFGMSLPAMLFSPDIKVWWEVGPVKNVEIRNNVIEYCANIESGANKAAVVFKACHDDGGEDYPAGVHENIYIHSNKFIDLPHSAIYLSAAKNVRIENNSFKNCCSDVKIKDTPYAFHDVVAVNCENLTLSGNVTDREESFLYTDGVVNK